MKPVAPPLVYSVATLGILMWGASPAATKIAVQSFDGFSLAVLRSFLAALLILPFALLRKLPIPEEKEHRWTLASAAVIGIVCYSILFSYGLERTSTIHAALIIACAPIFTGLIGFFMEKSWPRPLWWGGAFIALCGEALLILSKDSAGQTASLSGDLLVLASIICVSVGYVAGARLSTVIGSWAATAWSLVMAGVLLLPVMIYLGLSTNWHHVSPASWWALGYLVVFISILGYVCWYWAIGQLGVGPVAPLQFALPIVSIILGITLFGESLNWKITLATVIILSGIFITKKA